jgi:hypothetical protein
LGHYPTSLIITGGLVWMLNGCAWIQPSPLPGAPTAILSAGQHPAPGEPAQSPQAFYDLPAAPATCALTPLVGPEHRRTFPAWWLEGKGIGAGTPVGILFEGENKIQWQLEMPGQLIITGEHLGDKPAELPATVNAISNITYSSNVIFPISGCWHLQAHAGRQSLSAVVYVYPAGCRPQSMGGTAEGQCWSDT